MGEIDRHATTIYKAIKQSKTGIGRVLSFSDLGIFVPRGDGKFALDKDNVIDGGKVAVALTEYGDKTKDNIFVQHYLDIPKVRMLCHRILNSVTRNDSEVEALDTKGRLQLLDSYGGGAGSSAKVDSEYVSRHMSVTYTTKTASGEALYSGAAFLFTLELYKARKEPNGAFIKEGDAIAKASIMLNTDEMEAFALETMKYIDAKEVAAVMRGYL